MKQPAAAAHPAVFNPLPFRVEPGASDIAFRLTVYGEQGGTVRAGTVVLP